MLARFLGGTRINSQAQSLIRGGIFLTCLACSYGILHSGFVNTKDTELTTQLLATRHVVVNLVEIYGIPVDDE